MTTSQQQLDLMGGRGGDTYDHERDGARLDGQMLRVFEAMKDGLPHTPEELERLTGGDRWASISARVRDLRKPEYGGHEVVRTNLGGGSWSYTLVLRQAVNV